MNLIKNIIALVIISYSTISYSQIKLPSFFSSNMVLQQNTEVSIWGTDKTETEITVVGSWGEQETTTSDINGKWKVKIRTPFAGGPYKITIQGSETVELENVLMGEVWLCSGQSNMFMPVKGFNKMPINGSNETILNSKNNNIRLFQTEKKASVEPLDNVNGQWHIAAPSTVQNFSATAYFFAAKLENILNVPIGLIHTSWGGSKIEAWMDMKSLSNFKSIKIPSSVPKKGKHQAPTLLYNAMIHPFAGYGMKGIIWYQGESNRENASEYNKLFPEMIQSWREKWNNENLPFYFVQIAPFNYKEGANSAFLREAQLNTMKTVENTGMVVTLDIGNCTNIHPAEKKTVGNRLALWALSKTYNIEGIGFSGPVFKDMEQIKTGKIKLNFDYVVNGLSSFGKELIGFEISGEDKIFYKAQAQIQSDKSVLVWSNQVKYPVAVRYAFKNCTEGTLFNTEGLPASSFRTDNWKK